MLFSDQASAKNKKAHATKTHKKVLYNIELILLNEKIIISVTISSDSFVKNNKEQLNFIGISVLATKYSPKYLSMIRNHLHSEIKAKLIQYGHY